MRDNVNREKVLDMLDRIEEEVADGLGFQYEKWRKYACEMESTEETGEWVYDENGMDWNLPAWVCSKCHQRNDMIPTHIQYGSDMKRITNPYAWAGSHFCPSCGLKMKAKQM